MLTAQYDFLSAWLKAQTKSDRGASLVEYALLVALIAAVCVVAVRAFGSNASTTFNTSASNVKTP
ncbi:MAG: Flp family type IVb pilin [Microthrixaceae bacterium]